MKYELTFGEKPIKILIWRIWPGFGWWCHSRCGWSLCYNIAFYKAVNRAIKIVGIDRTIKPLSEGIKKCQ